MQIENDAFEAIDALFDSDPKLAGRLTKQLLDHAKGDKSRSRRITHPSGGVIWTVPSYFTAMERGIEKIALVYESRNPERRICFALMDITAVKTPGELVRRIRRQGKEWFDAWE